jgi:hypothetical protein
MALRVAFPKQCRLAWLLVPALPLVLLAVFAQLAHAEAFGRWKERPRRCTIEQSPAGELRCQSIQIDQRNAQVLRLSAQAQAAERGEQIQLTLVGALAEASEPMSCRSGSCSLRQSMQLQLISLSLTRFDARGLALTLPGTWPVSGSCRIEPAAIHCDAIADGTALADAIHWSLKAELR